MSLAPRHVLMTSDAIGGVWNYALELARGLASQGVAITLATMGPVPNAAQRAECRRIPGLELYSRPYRLEWMEEPWAEVEKAGHWLLELEERGRPDLVHLNGYAHAALPFRAPVLVVAHSCVLSWWKSVHGVPAPDSWQRYRREVARGLMSADMLVAPTSAMLSAIEEHYGIFGPAKVIANGSDPKRFRPGFKKDFVLSVGRIWDEGKNIAALDRIADQVDWPLYVAGDARHPEGGLRPLRHLRALGSVQSEALPRWYARAAIYALPARYEPFGLSVLEAALSGCALVLGDIPSLRELWEGAALFVHPDDPEALTAALRSLIGDRALRQGLADAARRRGAQWTNEGCARAYSRLYQRMLERAPRREPGESLCVS